MIVRFISFFLLMTICSPALFGQTISAAAGAVKGVKGEVFYHCHKTEKEFKELQKNVQLHDEDIVLTSETGKAALTLNPDSYLLIEKNTLLRLKETSLDRMRFDLERGEILFFVDSLKDGVSLEIHTPAKNLTVYKKGLYRVIVEENGNTKANVVRGELRYSDEKGNLVKIKKGKQINFVRRAV